MTATITTTPTHQQNDILIYDRNKQFQYLIYADVEFCRSQNNKAMQ